MSSALEHVPAQHRPALDNWIATAGRPAVAHSLAWLATYLLYWEPTGKVFGLSAPELQVLVQELTQPL